jgi:PAS domain S-box-containing protein
MGKKLGGQAHNEVLTDSKGVIVCILHGKQTPQGMRDLTNEIQERGAALRAEGKKVLTLTDARGVKNSDSSSETRLESKKLLSADDNSTDAAAIVGNRGVISMTMYLVRITHNNSKLRFFTNERKARAWLESYRHPKDKVRRPSVSLAAGVFVGSIGLLALIGWQLSNPYLMSGLSSLRPMNPLAAIGLLATGYGFICYYFGKLQQLKLAGIFGIILGVVALLPISVDHILYGHKVIAAGSHAQLADSAALCFIAVGLSPFTVGTKKLTVRVLQYTLGITIIGLSLFNIFGQLYTHDFIYGLSSSFVMAFNLAIAFLAVGCTLVLLVLYRQIGDILGGITRIGWVMIVTLVFVQGATYAAWSQTVTHNQINSSGAFLRRGDELDSHLDERINAYSGALYGFKGLFVASDYVDQGEFQSYYDSLNLSATYPGLRALSFISKVQEKDLPAFVAKHRSDASLHAGGSPGFAITAKSTASTHYIVTYSATTATSGGSDLGSNPSRLAAFEKAEALGRPVSSGTVEFAGANGQSAQKGFFLTIPVTSKSSGAAPVGFVNAVFNYQDFFAHAFSPKSLLDELNLSITDTMDGVAVYKTKSSAAPGAGSFTRTIGLPVADHTWNMAISAPATFGINSSQKALPRTILAGGQAFALLLIAIFVLQARARRQGFELADSITEDLERERSRAVANDQKSSAILSSIGDAVFAVDTSRRITLFNPSAQRMSGFGEAEVLGKRYDEILKFEFERTGRVNNRFIHEALAGKLTTMANHTVLIHKNGKRVPVADSAAPIRDVSGKVQGAIIVFRDVSKDYELDKAKTEFVSLASHQLRTPLSAINWYGEMLLNGDAGKLTKDQHEYIREIFEGNQRMIELVNSLLDVSRLEVGKLANQPAPTSVSDLIQSLEKELTPNIHDKSLHFVKAISNLPLVVADPKQLRMIVQNLLSNAVKYTPPKGTITATLRKATAADVAAAKLSATKPHWYFSVQDDGYGIPKDAQSKIFGKLYRADNVRKMDVEGTGLGLYIVKEVVEKLGGRVWFESTESVGTTFYVVLPLTGSQSNVVH